MASVSGHNSFETIAVQQPENSTLAPTGHFINSPTEISVQMAGILSWLGLFAIMGFVGWQARFINRVGRRGEPLSGEEGPLPDVPSFVESEYRSIVAYWPARADLKGVWLVGLFAFLSVLFAALLGAEAFSQSRLQFLGVYTALLCFSLAELVTCYTTYFIPSIEVAEERDH
ncbi:hypothetical protein GCM10009039_29740 [Halocalculus aciditolerans]|uniref:Uncharacterized protein n=1 Tax=Halocalculus aciditolerans TaxID=1383812 RepID=A0A830FFL4_9EURY|nr:hypothetical protein GCM10009039_29740 [Halocalculus aciditolerans]